MIELKNIKSDRRLLLNLIVRLCIFFLGDNLGNESIEQGITRVSGSRWNASIINEPREKRRWIRNVRHSSPRSLFIRCSYLSAMNDRRHAWLKTFPLDRPACSRRKYRAWILLSLVKKSQKVTPRIFRSSWISLSLSLSRIDCKEISTAEINTPSYSSLVEYTVNQVLLKIKEKLISMTTITFTSTEESSERNWKFSILYIYIFQSLSLCEFFNFSRIFAK